MSSDSLEVTTLLALFMSALDHLSASVDAVSLALMSFQSDSLDLTHLENEKYVVAIQRVSHALHNPQIMASDEALQSVLLLDLYEKMVNRNPQSSVSWMSHIQGAMSLANARGNRNFASDIARQLAIRLVVTLTISCGAASFPVPDAVMALRENLNQYANDIKRDFTAILVDVVNLKADLYSGRSTCPAEIARGARELDCRLENLENLMPPSWKPRRVFCIEHDSRLFGRYYDVYTNHFVTQLWNAVRMMRLAMNDMLLTHGLGDACSLETDGPRVISDITRQICAAVPQLILPEARPDNRVPFSPIQRLERCTLLTPLYLASQLSRDYYMRDWIIHSMEYMAETGHMKIAKDVTNILRTTLDVDFWTVYAMTGSYAFAA